MAVFHRHRYPEFWTPYRVPTGQIEIDWDAAPPGMYFCTLGSSLKNLVDQSLPIISGSGFTDVSQLGGCFNSNSGAAGWSHTPPGFFSFEFLVQTGTTLQGDFSTYDNNASGTSGTFERSVGINSSGHILGYIVSDSVQGFRAISSATATTNTIYHVVLINDPAGNLLLYVNGVLAASTPNGGNAAYSGYTTPFFILGKGSDQGVWAGQILLAIQSTAIWSASLVGARAADPFGFLRPQARRVFGIQTAAAASVPYQPQYQLAPMLAQ